METSVKTFWFDKLQLDLDVILFEAKERRIVIKDLNLQNEKVLFESAHKKSNTALIFNQSIDYKILYLDNNYRMIEQTTAVHNENGQVIIAYHKKILIIPLEEFYEIEKKMRTREVGRKFLEELKLKGFLYNDLWKIMVHFIASYSKIKNDIDRFINVHLN